MYPCCRWVNKVQNTRVDYPWTGGVTEYLKYQQELLDDYADILAPGERSDGVIGCVIDSIRGTGGGKRGEGGGRECRGKGGGEVGSTKLPAKVTAGAAGH
jgi:hypothetical protein